MEVMFVSASIGAGHNQAAAAIMAALEQKYPYIQTEFVDALKYTRWWFRPGYDGLYKLGFIHFPRLYGWFYRRLNRPRGVRRTLAERFRLFCERLATRPLQRHVIDRQPKLVVATHFLPAAAVGQLIARKRCNVRLWSVLTDLEPHRFWYVENVERYFVAHEQARQAMASWQVGPDRTVVAGIPVHPKWTAPLDADSIRLSWKLPSDVPIVVISSGAYFTAGPARAIARDVLDNTSACVVILTGSDKKLLARLASFPEHGSRIIGVPFTDRIHELAEVASVLITKPGGLITSECLAKGMPMVLTKPVPGQESANAELLAAEGAAIVTSSTEEVAATVVSLLRSPEARQALRANARRMYKPAAETIAAQIVQALDEGTTPPPSRA